jgi:MoxR-like ATPase
MDLQIKQPIELLINNIRALISVDAKKLEYIIAAWIAGGHVILADSHGVGKTSLARALARSIRWRPEDMAIEDSQRNPAAGDAKMEGFNRIQCTVDHLPQDILGYNRFIGNTG